MQFDKLDRLLAEHDFFRGLPPEDLEFIAGCGRNVHFGAGDYMFREGDPADLFFIVREGKVALEIAAPDRGALVVDTVNAGDILGVSWLFPPHQWQFDGRVVEPVRAVALDGVCLREKCDEDTRLGYELMRRLSRVVQRRMQSARLRLLDLYGRERTG